MIIGIDFDGTCVKHEFPDMGADIGAVPVLKKLVEQGHQLILWTMRSKLPFNGIKTLDEAVDWFKNNEIPLWGINENPTQRNTSWSDSKKQFANLYIDDAALGCPLTCDINYGNLSIDGRPYVDWVQVEQLLYKQGILQ